MQPGRCKISWNEASPLKYSSCSHIHACNPERNHKLGRSTCDMFLSTAPWFWFHSFPTAAWWNKGLLPRRTRSCLEQCGFLKEAGCGRAAIAFWNKMEPQSLWWHRRISFERWEDHKHIYRYRNDLEWLRHVAGGSKRIDSEVLVPWLQPGAGLQWESEWSEAQKSWSWQSWIQVLSTCTNSMCNKERCS